MSVLVLGVSHRSAPIGLLDEVALAATTARAMLTELGDDPRVAEAMVLATCNRLEVYAAVPRFHPAVDAVMDVIREHSGVPRDRLTPHVFVRHDEGAAEHLFRTASGLDSMAVGESQIRYQVKNALQAARDAGTAGPVIGDLVETALRVGKRVQTETKIDQAGRSLADEGFLALEEQGLPTDGATVLVLGAGSMASVATVAASRRNARHIVVINRDPDRAARLADSVGGMAAPWAELPEFLGKADVLVACTGAAGTVIDDTLITSARGNGSGRLGVLDLAMPHDVESSVRDLPDVVLANMSDLADRLGCGDPSVSETLAAAGVIVEEEVDAFVTAQLAAAVAPTVVALRRYADEVVATELTRLRNRLGDDLDPRADEEIASTVHRVVGKLLHTPTVRVKAAATSSEPTDYEAALRHLFDLDPTESPVVSLAGPEREVEQ